MKSKKIISSILAAALITGSVPGFVFADESEDTDIPEIIIEEEDPENAEPEEEPAIEEEIFEAEVIEAEAEEEQAEEITVEDADEEEVSDASITASGECGDDATWILYEDGTLIVSGTGSIYDFSSDVYPCPWNSFKSQIKYAVIDEGITSIGKNNFLYCDNLEVVSLPDTLTSIGNYSFYGCTSLAEVTIPDGVTELGSLCFGNCSALADVNISEDSSLTNIGNRAFINCTSLTTFTIPGRVTDIEYDAFKGCTSITDIYCYASAKSFYWSDSSKDDFMPDKETVCHILFGTYDQFYLYHSANVNVTFVDDMFANRCGETMDAVYNADTKTLTISGEGEMYDFTDEDTPWYDLSDDVEKLVINKGITSISDGAFYGFEKLEDIDFYDGLLTIGDEAFAGCTALDYVYIPETVTSIGSGAFSSCTGLEELYISSYTGLKTIPANFCSQCSSLKYFEIPGSITSIGENAFDGCTSLKDIYCYASPDDLTIDPDIGLIPDKATRFRVYYEDLESFTDLFSDYNFTILGDLDEAPCGEGITYYYRSGTLNIWGDGTMDDYQNVSDRPWNIYSDEITHIYIGSEVRSIGDNAFAGLENVTAVELGYELEEIGDNAFAGCTGITSAEFSKDLISIGDGAFAGCTGITQITLPRNITYIGDGAFAGCTGVTDVYAEMNPNNLTWDMTTGNFKDDGSTVFHIYLDFAEDFADIFSDLGIVFDVGGYQNPCGETCGWQYDEEENTLTILGTGDMDDYDHFTYGHYVYAPWYESRNSEGTRISYEVGKIVISDGIESIGSCAFYMCSSATEVVIPDSVQEIGEGAFYYNYNLPEITIPDGVEELSDSVFSQCSHLEEITIPSSVEYIGAGAFSGCSSLKVVNFEPDSRLKTIDYGAFADCSALQSFVFPETIEYIEERAFYECYNMNYVVFTADPSDLEWNYNNTYRDFEWGGTTECRVPWRYYQDYVDKFYDLNVHFVGNMVYLDIADTVNGTVTNVSGYAKFRDIYTLEIIPDEGYVVDTITVTKKNGDTVEVDMSDYSFKVPGTEEATVTVTFKEALGWIKLPDGSYTYYDSNRKLVTGWKKISGKYYFFNDDSVMQTGWLKDGKKWYYLTSNGDMVTGWKQISKKWYYFNAAGDMVTGWKNISGKYYYFNTSGAMQTGWFKDGSKYYYLGTDGAMVTGWQKVSGKWYYFNAGGDMVTGWKKIGTKWYYFQSSGAMQTANLTYKGKVYYFNSDGSCKNP